MIAFRRWLCVTWLALVLAVEPTAAQQAAAPYIDTQSGCIQCHQSGLRQNDFCPTIPAQVWEQDDKHRQAFWLLHETDPAEEQRGATKRALVKQILGFELSEAFTDRQYLQLKSGDGAETVRKVATVKACLRCHATWPQEADAEYAHDPPAPLQLGVSCQACHGPGQRWDQPHRLTAWRAVTPEVKAELGFYDCRSSAGKAKLCASCHVGNIAEGKFVKHEWYAAGHPPLPGFELASFQQQMPRHWKSLRDKGEFAFRARPPQDESGQLARQLEALVRGGVPMEALKSSYLEANFPAAVRRGVDPSRDVAAARDAIVGGAVVLESYARVIEEYSRQAARGERTWPELALYDCAACHHELRGGLGNASLRPRRKGVPGRPPLATWTGALAPLTAFQAVGFDEAAAHGRWLPISQALDQLELATTSRPFGDAAAMSTAAATLIAKLVQLEHEAAVTAYPSAAAQQSLQVLAAGRVYEISDFLSARQAAWAMTAISNELGHADAEQLFLVGGDDPLGLRLPSGPQRSVMENLHRWLPASAKYNAVWFKAELSRIRERLPPK